MKKAAVVIMVTTTLLFGFSQMGLAETFYFYKRADVKIPKKQRFDTFFDSRAKDIFPNLILQLDIPSTRRKFSNERDKLHFTVFCAVHPESNDLSHYWFSIESLSIRDEEKYYDLKPDLSLDESVSVDGMKIRSSKEQEVFRSSTVRNSYGVALVFHANPLPKRLFMDYKFKARKEGEAPHVFEGTLPLELASYNVGWWEKTRY